MQKHPSPPARDDNEPLETRNTIKPIQKYVYRRYVSRYANIHEKRPINLSETLC